MVEFDDIYSYELTGKCLLLLLGDVDKNLMSCAKKITQTLVTISNEPRQIRITKETLSISPSLCLPVQNITDRDIEILKYIFNESTMRTTFSTHASDSVEGIELGMAEYTEDIKPIEHKVVMGPVLILCAFWKILTEYLGIIRNDFKISIFDSIMRGILQNFHQDSTKLLKSLEEIGYFSSDSV